MPLVQPHDTSSYFMLYCCTPAIVVFLPINEASRFYFIAATRDIHFASAFQYAARKLSPACSRLARNCSSLHQHEIHGLLTRAITSDSCAFGAQPARFLRRQRRAIEPECIRFLRIGILLARRSAASSNGVAALLLFTRVRALSGDI